MGRAGCVDPCIMFGENRAKRSGLRAVRALKCDSLRLQGAVGPHFYRKKPLVPYRRRARQLAPQNPPL